MKFAKYVFYVAGIYGIVALFPHYFLESKIEFIDMTPGVSFIAPYIF